MSFIIDEPDPPRRVVGVPVVVYVVGAGGRSAIVSQTITFGYAPLILRDGEHLEVAITDPDGRVT